MQIPFENLMFQSALVRVFTGSPEQEGDWGWGGNSHVGWASISMSTEQLCLTRFAFKWA